MARVDIDDHPDRTGGAFSASLVWYFAVGVALIVAVKLGFAGLPGATLAAAIALLAVFLKCWGHWGDRGHAASWASDEVYYLGLLYTLISLILAIVQAFILGASDSGLESLRSQTSDLIGNFGIALISTVAGILGRILLQTKSVTEPSATPSTTTATPTGQAIASPKSDLPPESQSLETPLAGDVREQVQALRRNLFEAADGFAHFTRVTLVQAEGTRASAERVIDGFNERLAQIARSEIQGIAANWQDAIAAMRDEHGAAISETTRDLLQLRQRWTDLGNQAQAEIDRLTERFEAAATQALQQTEAGWSRLAAALSQSAEAMRRNSEMYNTELNVLLTDLGGLRQRVEPLGAALADATEAVNTFQEKAWESMTSSGDIGLALQDVKQTLLALNDTTKRVDADLISQVAEMGKAYRAMVDGCKSLITDVDALCRIALESIADRTQDTTTVLGQAGSQADSLKERIEELAVTLDTQRNKAERNTAQFESLLQDMLQNSTDNADHRKTASSPQPGKLESVAHSPLLRTGAKSPAGPKSKHWWQISRGGDSS